MVLCLGDHTDLYNSWLIILEYGTKKWLPHKNCSYPCIYPPLQNCRYRATSHVIRASWSRNHLQMNQLFKILRVQWVSSILLDCRKIGTCQDCALVTWKVLRCRDWSYSICSSFGSVQWKIHSVLPICVQLDLKFYTTDQLHLRLSHEAVDRFFFGCFRFENQICNLNVRLNF